MPWPCYSGLSSRLRGRRGGKAGGDGVGRCGGGGGVHQSLLERGLPSARTLPGCGRGVIGPILSGQGTRWEKQGPRRIQNHGPKSRRLMDGDDENRHDRAAGAGVGGWGRRGGWI